MSLKNKDFIGAIDDKILKKCEKLSDIKLEERKRGKCFRRFLKKHHDDGYVFIKYVDSDNVEELKISFTDVNGNIVITGKNYHKYTSNDIALSKWLNRTFILLLVITLFLGFINWYNTLVDDYFREFIEAPSYPIISHIRNIEC